MRSLPHVIVAALSVALTTSAVSPGSRLDERPAGLRRLVTRADRIVHATVTRQLGEVVVTGAGPITLAEHVVVGGRTIVVRRHEVEVLRCLHDRGGPCPPGSLELWVPGGTVRRQVGGRTVLVDVTVGDRAIGAAPRPGAEALLFLQRAPGAGAYRLVPQPGAQRPVERADGVARVEVVVDDPRLLSEAARREPANAAALRARAEGRAGPAAPRRLLRETLSIAELATRIEHALALEPAAEPAR